MEAIPGCEVHPSPRRYTTGSRLPTASPRSLRAFLGAGGDVTRIDWWYRLAETVALDLEAEDEHRQRSAMINRDLVGSWLDGCEMPPGTVKRWVWEAECREDVGLALRLIDALPSEAVDELVGDLEG